MTIQEKTCQIEAIDQKIATLEQQISNANAKIRQLVDERDKSNDKFKKIRQETQDLETERDSLNERVQDLKMLRNETRSKTQVVIQELKDTTIKIRELKKKTPKRSHSDLQKELDGIEWKIQTTSIELDEEKKLIENVKQLEIQLSAYKKIEKQKGKMTFLRKNLVALNAQADAFHSEVQNIARKSQEIHSKMLSKISESKRIKAEADNLHSAYIQERKKIEPLSEECRKLHEQRKILQGLIRREEETKQKDKQQELKQKTISEAREKLQKGEKLSWNEFQLLNENDV